MTKPDCKTTEILCSEAVPFAPVSTTPPSSGTPMRICCELPAQYFATASPAQAYARQTGGRVYSWKNVGEADWLEVGVWCCDVFGLLVLPPGLPDFIDLREETDLSNDDDERSPERDRR